MSQGHCVCIKGKTKVTCIFNYTGVSKIALQWYSKCYCVARVTNTFTLKCVQTIHHSRCWTMHSLYACMRKRFVANSLVLTFRYALLLFRKCLMASCLITLRLYTRIFRLNAITTAVWLVSFDLIISSILVLLRTMTYAWSIHNNVDSLRLKFLYSF
jgi:hypothetical protein